MEKRGASNNSAADGQASKRSRGNVGALSGLIKDLRFLDIHRDVLNLMDIYLTDEERIPLKFTCKLLHNLPVVKNCKPVKSYALVNALALRQWSLSDWLDDKLGYRLNETAGERAAEVGNLEVIRLICVMNRKKLDDGIYNTAAYHGHLEILKWAKVSIENFPEMCDAAAAGGYIAVLDWLSQNGFALSESTSASAAARGDLKVLEWLRAKGCPFDEFTCFFAAANGHLNILQWLRERNCPWDWRVRGCAESQGYNEVLNWAIANGCPEYPRFLNAN